MLLRIHRISLAIVFAILSVGMASAQTEKMYFFGNSLIHHLSNTTKTTVPYWLAHFGRTTGRDFELDGQWGFMREFDEKLPPLPEWEFKTVPSAWGNARSFDSVGYDAIVFNPTNFIQYRGPNRPYEWDNPTQETPVSVALNLLDKTAQGKKVYVYQGWADMDPFGYPPSRRKLKKYHQHNTGDYHQWYVDFVRHLERARPDLEIELIPVARVLSRAFLETGLSKIQTLDIYADDMAHGSETLYYLAAAITYAGLFDEMPSFGELPSGIDPLVEPYFNGLKRIIAEEISVSEKKAVADVMAPKPENEAAVVKTRGFAPSLGIGLNAISDWSTQLPFVDHMKSARPWVGHRRGAWGGYDEADLIEKGMLDANGWPMSMPRELDGIETFVLTDLPTDLVEMAGVYRIAYEGQGKIDLTGLARPLRYGDGEIWFRFAPGEGSVGIKISETDPEGTGDYIRDISVVREDQIPLLDLGVTFNPDWVRIIEDMRVVRFMDWMQTNETTVSTWAERPQPGDYTYMRRGAPVEVMIALANQIGADAWFNMPHLADDTYVQGFAEIVRDGLRPGLKAHVEYSNEMWNFIFPQTDWAMKAAKDQWGRGAPDDAWFQYAGLRAAKVMEGWTKVFEGQENRIVRVAGVHTGWIGLEESFLEAPLDPNLRPADSFDAYAVTGYFGDELGGEDGPANVKRWLKKGKKVAIENAVSEIRKNSFAFLTKEAWPHHAKVAKSYGLDFIMYEGGTHVVGHGDWVNDRKLTEFFAELNYAPEMGLLYQDVLAAWTNVGGTLFNGFVDVASPSKWGSWGALRSLGDQNARFDALVAYNGSGLGRPDARAADVFANGVQRIANETGETLDGSVHTDILLGRAGDDTLISHGGNDVVDGGEGLDHLELQGFMEEYRFFRDGQALRAVSQYGSVVIKDVETMSFSKMPGVNVDFANFF